MEQFREILVQKKDTIIWNPNSAQKECKKGTNTDTWNRDIKHSACWSSVRSWLVKNIITFDFISWKKEYWELRCTKNFIIFYVFKETFHFFLRQTKKNAYHVDYIEIAQFKRNVSHRHLFITTRLAISDNWLTS